MKNIYSPFGPRVLWATDTLTSSQFRAELAHRNIAARARQPKRIDSAIVWRGISALDHKTETVAIVTGLDASSGNPKTGKMAQLWILVAGMSPLAAAATGADAAICGDCIFRGKDGKERGCYVVLAHGPRSVYAKFSRGGYPVMAPETIATLLRASGMHLRLGAYGDPAVLPRSVIQRLTDRIPGHTGYSSSWQMRPDLAPYVMASAKSSADVELAHSLGFRTFRTRAAEQPILPNEITCPASIEAGHRTDCDRCTLCNGATVSDSRKSIVIIAHGTPSVHALKFIRASA